MSDRVFICADGRRMDIDGIGFFVVGDPGDPAACPGFGKWKAGGEFYFDEHAEAQQFQQAWLAYMEQ